jgi:hypothetical protein
MLTAPIIRVILARLKYKGWVFRLVDDHHHFFLQLEWWETDFVSKQPALQRSRRWLIETDMTESEVVQTAWLAIQTAEIHEARERFTYVGRRVFGPHLDVRAVFRVVDNKQLDYAKR